jgi:hypothetical protein
VRIAEDGSEYQIGNIYLVEAISLVNNALPASSDLRFFRKHMGHPLRLKAVGTSTGRSVT